MSNRYEETLTIVGSLCSHLFIYAAKYCTGVMLSGKLDVLRVYVIAQAASSAELRVYYIVAFKMTNEGYCTWLMLWVNNLLF
jgi:hypothetical protein